MPLLSGEALTDASAGALTDASPAALTEAGIEVMQDGTGLLWAEGGGQGGGLLDDFLDWLKDPAGFAEILALTPILQNITNGIAMLLGNQEKLTKVTSPAQVTYQGETNWQGFTITEILDRIDGIDPGGGMTQEEHDALLALENIDYEQIAGDVWGYTLSLSDAMQYDEGPMAQTVLTSVASYLVAHAAYDGIPVPDRPHFKYCTKQPQATIGWLGYWTNTAESTDLPLLDLSLVEAGDTVWSYLNREYDTYTWLQAAPSSWPVGGNVWLEQSADQAYYRCTLTDADIQACWPVDLSGVELPDILVPVPPVWPGVANVTLGTPRSLWAVGEIMETMDGVIVEITSVDDHTAFFTYGDVKNWRHVGALAFVDDDGHLESYQALGFESAIYCPRHMTRAGGVKVFTGRGVSGTITPWVVNP